MKILLLALTAAIAAVAQIGTILGTQAAPGGRPVPIPGAPPAVATSGTQERKPPGKIEGRVLNAVTGEPLKRANVMIIPAEPGPDSMPSSTTTDAAGKFVLTEVAPGKYRLSAERTGFVRGEYGARGVSRMGTTVTVGPAQELKQIDFRMQPHAVVAGRVLDDEGEPLAGVQVQTLTYRYLQGKRQLLPTGGANTNDLGEYRIFGLQPGRYYLSATYRNMMMSMATSNRSAPSAPEEGFVPTYYPGTIDPAGAVPIQVAAGRPLTGVDVRLSRARTVRVRGKVTNATASGRMMVMLIPRESTYFGFDRNTTSVRPNDGTFELRGVAPGAYNVMVQSFDGQDRQVGIAPVDAGNTDVEGIEVTLAPGMEVTGTLKVEGDGQVNPATIRVFLEPKDTPMLGGGMSTTKDDGSFSIRNIVPGAYRVRVMGQDVYLKSLSLGSQEAKDGEITIIPGTAAALAVTVSTAGGQVAGVVKGDNDTPFQGATVVLVPDTAKRQQQALYRNVSTDQSGTFSITGIAPGQYKVFAWDSVEMGQWMDPDFLQAWEGKGEAVVLKESAKETKDLKILKVEAAQ